MTAKIAALEKQINELWQAEKLPETALGTVETVLDRLDDGTVTVVEKSEDSGWSVNSWVKKAILLYFRLKPIEKFSQGPFCDKVPLKHPEPDRHRLVPYSSVRRGSYIGARVVVMAPSFVNIGAYVDEGSMIDSLVLVGSCARIGKNVHLGAGTVIGGVLEPPGSQPVIIEDDVFVGGNCGIYEGCLVEAGAVVGAGTIITAGTPIIDVQTGEKFYGRIPANSVVVPGSRIKHSEGAGEKFYLHTPLIIKRRDPRVSAKVAMEESLRSF